MMRTGHVKDLSPSAPARTGWWPLSSRDMRFRTKSGFVTLPESQSPNLADLGSDECCLRIT